MKLRSLYLALGLLLVLFAGSAGAADLISTHESYALAKALPHFVTTDGSVALRIRWTGTAGAGATVAVDASGNIVFTKDGTNADTSVNATGTIPVSAAAASTFGKVVGLINASSNWKCILVDVCPSWATTGGHPSAGVLKTMAASATGAVEKPDGVSLVCTTGALVNTSGIHCLSACLGPEWQATEYQPIYAGHIENQKSTPKDSGASTWTNLAVYVRANAAFTTGTTTLTVYAVKDDTDGATELQLWSQTGAATTVDSTVDLTSIWDYDSGLPMMLCAPKGWRIVAAYTGTGLNITSGQLQIHGLMLRQ